MTDPDGPRYVAGPDESRDPSRTCVWSVVDTLDGSTVEMWSAPADDPEAVLALQALAGQAAEEMNERDQRSTADALPTTDEETSTMTDNRQPPSGYRQVAFTPGPAVSGEHLQALRDGLRDGLRGEPAAAAAVDYPPRPVDGQPMIEYRTAPRHQAPAAPEYVDDPWVPGGEAVRPYVLPRNQALTVPADMTLGLTLTVEQWEWLDIVLAEAVRARAGATSPGPTESEVRALYYPWCSQVLSQMQAHADSRADELHAAQSFAAAPGPAPDSTHQQCACHETTNGHDIAAGRRSYIPGMGGCPAHSEPHQEPM